jgi:cbb3-type cytochrome oxidase cytochrome c subunit
MAFGIKRQEMEQWKAAVARGEIAFLTHYWLDPRFPDMRTVTKVGCADMGKLSRWCLDHGLNPRYIHARSEYPHFDLLGPKQREILKQANQMEQLERFGMQ